MSFIEVQETPNPNTMKFLPQQELLSAGTMTYMAGDDLSTSPLAQALFTIEGIQGIFIAKSFLSVTKAPDDNWDVIKTMVLTTLMDHLVAGKPIILEEKFAANESANNSNDDEVIQQIKELIETRVRPAVAQDGGDIVYQGFSEGIVYLKLQGACSGCPSSSMTLKGGIENMLKHYVPEVIAVEAVD